jgi:prolyl oligopeptidase PreP (S9A serine peptidase family)
MVRKFLLYLLKEITTISFGFLFFFLEKKQYPATLVLTADHDDRVSPLHSYKFIAALQDSIKACEHQKNPVLLRVYSKAGHGMGKPTAKRVSFF